MNAEDYFVVGGAIILACSIVASGGLLALGLIAWCRGKLRDRRDREKLRRMCARIGSGTSNAVALIGGAAICWALARLPQ